MTHEEAVAKVREQAATALEMRVHLSVPIKVNGVEQSDLTMRRPTVGDMRRMTERKGTDADREIWLIAHLCSVPPDALDAVDLSDWDVVQAALLGFRNGRATVR